ncbi:MAG: hypothetical protein JO287_18670 [Pseudonocardiales bacterium]|nr:hypothetical protein [Pseudonocardiales bacterium]
MHTDGVLAGLVAHLAEWGLGSVSETADGDPPHAATGCPFRAFSARVVGGGFILLADAGARDGLVFVSRW